MASLLDTLKKNTVPQQMGAQDNTTLAANLQRAKSGKAASPTGPISNIGEQTAVQNTNQELQQVGQQATLQNEQAAMQQQATQEAGQQQETELQQQRTGSQLENRIRTNQLFNELESEGKKLDLEKDKSKLEQLAFGLAMQDKKYVTQLQNEGQRKRLNDKISFGDEMARQQLGDGMDILKTQLGNKSIVSASKREYTQALAQMDISQALEMANAAMKASNTQQLYSGLGGMASAGIGAWANGSFASKPQGTTTTGVLGTPASQQQRSLPGDMNSQEAIV